MKPTWSQYIPSTSPFLSIPFCNWFRYATCIKLCVEIIIMCQIILRENETHQSQIYFWQQSQFGLYCPSQKPSHLRVFLCLVEEGPRTTTGPQPEEPIVGDVSDDKNNITNRVRGTITLVLLWMSLLVIFTYVWKKARLFIAQGAPNMVFETWLKTIPD